MLSSGQTFAETLRRPAAGRIRISDVGRCVISICATTGVLAGCSTSPDWHPTWDASLKIGDFVTAVSVLIALAGFLYSWNKDRQVRIKEYADRVRSAAAETLARVDRCKSIFEAFYERIQPEITETDAIMVQGNDWVKTRDYFWKACYTVRQDILTVFREENIELAYAPLLGYRQNIYRLFKNSIEAALQASTDSFDQFCEASQSAVMNMEGKKAVSAVLGNRIRSLSVESQLSQSEQMRMALGSLEQFLLETIAMSDKEIIQEPRLQVATGDKEAAKGTRGDQTTRHDDRT